MSEAHGNIEQLDLSIGPVQGFVAQSRRTRDLWGSSFLLAFLSAHAMRGAREAGGKITRPLVDNDPLLAWVEGRGKGLPPQLGSLPNHFVVEVTADKAKAVAEAARQALVAAWKKAAGAVYAEYVAPHLALGDDIESRWARQVDGYWEVQWAAGAKDASGLLARRKLWRSHRLPEESGDKCCVMSELQELSGFVRSTPRGREKQDAFWSALRARVGDLELRDDERLCAIALIKRLFARVSEAAIGWKVERTGWPSTVYLAALPWISEVTQRAPKAAEDYARAVEQAAPWARSEYNKAFPHLRDGHPLSVLDANWFHEEALIQPKLCPLKDETRRSDLREKLRALRQSAHLGPPSGHYALLLADGDRLGQLVRSLGGREVGRALANFTQNVPGVVREHRGVTVYAGGDDVLALLPLDGALACAQALRDAYGQAFEQHATNANATLSAALVFAPIRWPFASLLAHAHALLDEQAKERNGRDSVAVSAVKGGTPFCVWVTSWRREGAARAVDLLTELDASLGRVSGEPGISSALIYRLREQLGLLCGWPSWEPGARSAVHADLDLTAFLRAEVAQGLRESEEAEASALAAQLTALLTPWTGGGGGEAQRGKVELDGLLLGHFLHTHRSVDAQGARA